MILNNHGAHQTSFHGAEFFGYDNRISKLMDQISLNLYEDCLIDNVSWNSRKLVNLKRYLKKIIESESNWSNCQLHTWTIWTIGKLL